MPMKNYFWKLPAQHSVVSQKKHRQYVYVLIKLFKKHASNLNCHIFYLKHTFISLSDDAHKILCNMHQSIKMLYHTDNCLCDTVVQLQKIESLQFTSYIVVLWNVQENYSLK